VKKHLARIVIGLLIVAVFFFHERGDYELPLLRKIENIAYDTKIRLTMPGGVDPSIVILDIDEKSLKEREQGGEGRWPWPRDRMALMLDKLFDKYQIEVLGFDVVFPERDETSGVRVLERLAANELSDVPQFKAAFEKIKPQLEYDDIFARKMQGRKVVLGYTFLEADASKKGMLPAPVFGLEALGNNTLAIPPNQGYTANLPVLQKSAVSAGHFNPETEQDGVIRRVPLFSRHGDHFYEALSLAVVRAYYGMPPVKLVFADYAQGGAALEEVSVGGLKIPVDERSRALIPYRGPRGSFRYISLVDVMNDRVDVNELRGKIALVGTTAPGLQDIRVAPVDAVYPGVEAHANLIAGMVDGTIKRRPAYAEGAQLVVVMAIGMILAFLLPFLSIGKSTAITLLLLTASAGLNLWLFSHGNFVLPVATSLILILCIFGFNTIWGYFKEAHAKKQIEGLFGQYVPPELVDEMAESPGSYNMAPRAAELSVLFSDVRGFTTISEALSPEDLSSYINEYLTTMSKVIREGHRGTLDKYIGDAIMAFWGAPVADANHAQNAVLAAMNMQKQAKTVNEKFAQKGWPPFKIGVGVNSGVMRVGDMGSQIRRAYTVMGDAVNLGSRLEGITKEYGADILLGEVTKGLISGIACREVDRVRVKGKDEPIAIFQPLGLEHEISDSTREQIDIWGEALRMYRAQDWDGAEEQLLKLKSMETSDELYDIFLGRVAGYRANPPLSDWDGVYKFETK
jgi:adenylate cyclase